MVLIKGQEFAPISIKDSHDRRALQCKNKIIACLKALGITEDDIDVPLEKVAIRKAQASVSWYIWERHLFCSHNGSAKFVENLAMVLQVIEHFVLRLRREEISQEEFLELFEEESDILERRAEAREILGVEKGSTDFETMHKEYKRLSKEHHPDMPTGDLETFKRINNAHKILKRELH